jgi:hypothetical protein
MKHRHDWTPLFSPATTREELSEARCRGEYVTCSCGALGSPSNGRSLGGGGAARRVVEFRGMSEERKSEIKAEAAEWNGRRWRNQA